ncbi:hypothetical protein PRIPAC_84924, partial [Pristionchus pacificus]
SNSHVYGRRWSIDRISMALEQLTPDQQQVYWEVKEWFPHASRAALITHIGQGLDALIALCDDGTIPQDDYDPEDLKAEEQRETTELERAMRASVLTEQHSQLLQQPHQLEPQVVRVMHVGAATAGLAAGAAAPLLQQLQQPVAAASKPTAAAAAAAAAAPPPAQAQPQCSICKKSTSSVARCHWPINKATGDLKEEDPNAHACCAKCLTSRYVFKKITITSRVAISCLKKGCTREIHQDRLVSDAGLKPALAHWMLGFTEVTVGNARRDNTVRELKRAREEEPEITDEERERLTVIMDHMDHDKFAYLVDQLPGVDFIWLLDNIDCGTVEMILDRREHEDTVPKRRRRRLDKKGVTNLVEDRLKMETTYVCGICCEEAATALGVPCVQTGGGGDAPSEQHLFCGSCIRGHATAAAQEQPTIVRAGLGLRCMADNCTGVLIYAHVEPLLEAGVRELLEEKIAAAALAAAAVNVERCQRCPFAAIVDLPIGEQQTFACRRCAFEYCRYGSGTAGA